MRVGPISCPSCTGHHRVEEQKGYVLFSDLFSKFPGDVALLFKKKMYKKIFVLKQRGEHSVGSTGVSFEKNTVLMDNNV